VQTSSQLVSTGARGVRVGTRRLDDCRAYVLPNVRELPLRLAPTTIEVVRPERTIVRDVDQALPIALAGSALVLVLAMIGVTLVRTRLVPRPGRSH
jgi:hypothetical protein